MKKLVSMVGALYLVPGLVAAQTFTGGNLDAYIQSFVNFVNQTLLPAIIALAFLVFIWGIFQYFVFGATDEEKRAKGRTLMLWGIIGFIVMITIVGIVNLLVTATGLQNEETIPTPDIPFEDN